MKGFCMKKLDRGCIIMVLLFIYIIFNSLATYLLFTNLDVQIGLMYLIIISQATSFGIPFLLYLIFTRQSFSSVVALKSLDLKNFFLVIGIVLCSMPMAGLLSAFTSLFVDNQVSEILLGTATTYPFWLALLAIGVAPSIFEELMFRGAIFKEYKHMSIHRAAIINGFFFGAIHLNFQQFFYAFALGVLFSYLLHYTGSFIAPVIGHFIINGLNVTMIYLVVASMDMLEYYGYYNNADEPSPIFAVIFMAGLSIFIAPLFMYLLRALISHNKPVQEI
jgi:membrane protease YdiL (CAAX protease family)